ncbi:MAG: ABC transporter ATP-binding protein [Steroidobacteraceae bacterium]|nr:ABC transporter ATP-binding protein [Steroidobacteraceae bacterium]
MSGSALVAPARKVLALLTARERLHLVVMFGVLLVVAILQTVGIASIMPFVAVVTNPEVVESNAFAKRISGYLGLTSANELLVALGFAVLALMVIGNAARIVALWMTLRYENSLSYRMAHRLLTSYVHRSYTFFLNRNASELGKNVLSEVRTVVSGVIHPCLNIAANTLVAIAVIVLLIVVNPGVAVVITLALGAMYGLVYFTSRRLLQRIGAEQVRANAQKYKAANEVMSGIKDIKILGNERHFLDRFKRHAARHARNNVWAGVISAAPRYLLESIAFGGMIAILIGFMARGVPTDEVMPLIALYAFAGYRLLPAFQVVYSSFSQLRFNTAALDHLHADLVSGGAAETDGAASPAGAPIVLARSLRLEGATLVYPGAKRASLDGFDVEIAANTTVAFVGPTGSGKTTAVDTILGLLPLTGGRLLVDGEPIDRGNVRRWQSSLGYVPQQIYLVDDTLARNIALGVADSQIDMDAVRRAAAAANLHEFIENDLPERYSTVVGDRGVRLSGGQRQRVGIARALYRNPSTLIFDEATSALDGVTEEAIMSAIRSLAGRKTIILIAHRLSTVQHADRIFVVEGGSVVAAGTHQELVQSCGWFRMASGEG